MKVSQRVGIIDIGSNSIRLVIYEVTVHGGYHLIDESKASARLSQRIESDGLISQFDIDKIIKILKHFQLLCEANQTNQIRAVATAAIRNATNSHEVMQQLITSTGLSIEVISGYDEARLGFIGVMNTMEIQDGFLIDIGGGSTEVTLFLNREIKHTISFPIGAVNTAKQFLNKKDVILSDEQVAKKRKMIEKSINQEPWICQYPGLPLVGLGGTIRQIAKIHQKQMDYSLNSYHNYQMDRTHIEQMLALIHLMPLQKRKKIDGMSSDRVDIIVPGMCIYLAIAEAIQASKLIVSGAGLREGLLFETLYTDRQLIDNVLEHSVRNLLALHPSVPLKHVLQVKELALNILRALLPYFTPSQHATPSQLHMIDIYLSVAALLYRIGVTVSYDDYARHTYYLLIHARLNGLTHRDIVFIALIASFRNKSLARQIVAHHKDLLAEEDLQLIVQLASILKLAIALDRSETQPIRQMHIYIQSSTITLELHTSHDCSIEWNEIHDQAKEFQKQWGLHLHATNTSMS